MHLETGGGKTQTLPVCWEVLGLSRPRGSHSAFWAVISCLACTEQLQKL